MFALMPASCLPLIDLPTLLCSTNSPAVHSHSYTRSHYPNPHRPAHTNALACAVKTPHNSNPDGASFDSCTIQRANNAQPVQTADNSG